MTFHDLPWLCCHVDLHILLCGWDCLIGGVHQCLSIHDSNLPQSTYCICPEVHKPISLLGHHWCNLNLCDRMSCISITLPWALTHCLCVGLHLFESALYHFKRNVYTMISVKLVWQSQSESHWPAGNWAIFYIVLVALHGQNAHSKLPKSTTPTLQ